MNREYSKYAIDGINAALERQRDGISAEIMAHSGRAVSLTVKLMQNGGMEKSRTMMISVSHQGVYNPVIAFLDGYNAANEGIRQVLHATEHFMNGGQPMKLSMVTDPAEFRQMFVFGG